MLVDGALANEQPEAQAPVVVPVRLEFQFSAGIKLDADCHQGVCGMDPVKVLEGGEHLNPIGGTERSTLEDLCSVEPGPYRLACMARVSGLVKVAFVKQ